MSLSTGEKVTSHTTCDVYCFVIDDNVKEISNGSLANIAPTVLQLMQLPIPDEMEKSLIQGQT